MTITPPRYAESAVFHRQAAALMPGGVSSPVRAFKAMGMDPITVLGGEGCHLSDVDGHRYVDYVMSYGPLIFGHAPKVVIDAITEAAQAGTTFGMTTPLEIELARLVVDFVPSVEVVRFVNSGTEAAMSAVRLARGYTKRDLIIKCSGCYHGHSDGMLVDAGSGAATLGVPSSPGVPSSVSGGTVVVPFNDLPAMSHALKEHAGRIAAVCVEPIAGNMSLVPPVIHYLKGLRDLCDEHKSLLIFDEVMTGFRVHPGGAQSLYGVMPDLTCLGKVIGGGLPCAAYGGRERIMRYVAPDGPVYQAGTLSGNPLAMAAGIATLTALRDPSVYQTLDQTTALLEKGLVTAATKAGLPLQTTRVGSMLGLFFTDHPVTNFEQVRHTNIAAYAPFFQTMLEHGVMLPPSAYEAWFISTAHTREAVAQTVGAAVHAFKAAADFA